MQGSKIVPKQVYAINDKETGGLQRFRVSAVITTRVGDGPSNYSTVVEGRVLLADRAASDTAEQRLSSDAILGPYAQYAELKAREDAEKKAKQDEADRKQALRERCVALLYEAAGLQPQVYEPAPTKAYVADPRPIKPGYGDVQINDAALDSVIAGLERLLRGPGRAAA